MQYQAPAFTDKRTADEPTRLEELMQNPRFKAAIEKAKRLREEGKPLLPEPEPYNPPDKPLHQFTHDELKEAVERCQFCNGMGRVRFDVPIEHELFGKTKPCPNCHQYQIEERRRRELKRLEPIVEQYSMLTGNLRDATFKSFQASTDDLARVRANVRNWAAGVFKGNPDPAWLYLYGQTGNGKSHLAAAAANGLIKAHVPVLFSTFPEILGMVSQNKYSNQEQAISTLQWFPVVVIDDIRQENLRSNWTTSVLFRIVDRRYVERKPTLFVGNHPVESDKSSVVSIRDLEFRVASRLLDRAVCRVVCNTGDDYRTKQYRPREEQ
jgi:DNA replication protein DnaC